MPSPSSLPTVVYRSRRLRRRSASTSRFFSRPSLLVLAAAVAEVAASVAPVTPFPSPQLVEPVAAPPSWTIFLGKFSGGEENPPRDSPATGTAVGMVWGRDLHLRWSFSDLTTPFNAIHVHTTPPGKNNPAIVVDLYPLTTHSQGGRAGRGNTTVTLTPAGLQSAAAGNIYLNVHTTSLPAGEARTQLWPVSADQLAKTGEMTSAATAAVVAAGRRHQAEDGGGKTAAVAVGIVAALLAVGAALFVGVTTLRRRKAGQQAEARVAGSSPRVVAAAATSATVAGAGTPKGLRTPPKAEALAREEELQEGAWARGGPLRAATPAADDEYDDQIAPLSPQATVRSGSSRTTDGGWRSPDALQRSASSKV